MSLKNIFYDSAGTYKVISAHDWNSLNVAGITAIDTNEGDFNILVDNSDPHAPILALNSHVNITELSASGNVGCANLIATTASVGSVNVGVSINAPLMLADHMRNGTLTLPNTTGFTGSVLGSDGGTGTMWVALTDVGLIQNTDGNLSIVGTTGAYDVNFANSIVVNDSIGILDQYTLPTLAGTTGTVLTYNGDGTCSFLTAPVVSIANQDGNLSIIDTDGGYNVNFSNDIFVGSLGITGQYTLPTVDGDNGDGTCSFLTAPVVNITNDDGNLTIVDTDGGYDINFATSIHAGTISITEQYSLPTSSGVTGTVITSNGDGTSSFSAIPAYTSGDGNLSITGQVIDFSTDVEIVNLTIGVIDALNTYTMPTLSNLIAGQIIRDNGDNTTEFVSVVNSDGNIVINNLVDGNIQLNLNSSGITVDTLTVGGMTGLYELPLSAQFATNGQVMTYDGSGHVTFTNVPNPASTVFTYTNLTFSNGIDTYTMPSITFTKDYLGNISFTFNYSLSSIYIVSSLTNISAPFKSSSAIDVSLRPPVPTTLSYAQGALVNNTVPYAMTAIVDVVYSIDSNGYLYISNTWGTNYNAGSAYVFSVVTQVDMSDPLGYAVSNVCGLYRLL